MASSFHEQDRDLELLLRLYARLSNRVVIDVGAERGVFVDAFLAAGCPRVHAFEPYPPHARHLGDRFRGSDRVRVFEMALGARDRMATLHIAEDEWGRECDFHHSLVDFAATPEVRWGRALPVTCRSLGSLVDDGTLPSEVGVLKIDTEGYDLEVIRGMGRLSSSIVMVEYWDTLPAIFGPCPYSLHEMGEALRSRGYSNALVIKRHDDFEAIQIGSLATRPGDWGNAIFVHDRLYPDLGPLLHDAAVEAQTKLIDAAIDLRSHGEQRLRIIAELRTRRIGPRRRRWLYPRIGTLRHHPPRPLAIPAWYGRPAALAAPPVISVVTAVLNSRRFLERTVRSVLDQQYPKLEYVVQDGGSTDGSVAILERYGSALASFEVARDRGQADALNRGFARTTGEIMAYLNGDDLLLPGALQCIARFFSRHPDVDVVYGHRVLIDEHDQEIGRWVMPPHDPAVLSWADYVPQETLFWRRRIWERVGARLDDTFHFAMDWDLLLRFRAAGARCRRIPRFLGAFRVHDEQKSSALINDVGASEMARLREREHGRPVGQAELSRSLRGFLLRHIVYQKLYRLGLLRY
jgi:FkbM family methyltransferase